MMTTITIHHSLPRTSPPGRMEIRSIPVWIAIICCISTISNTARTTFHINAITTDIEGRRPNIILFLADNLGYADISWLQQQHQLSTSTPSSFETTNIDSIGQNGMTFQNWNSAAHLCSASRAALLTGNYPARLGIYPGTFQPDAQHGLKSDSTGNDNKKRKKNSNTSTSTSSTRSSNDPHRSSITLASLLKKYSKQSSHRTTHTSRRSQKQYATAMIGKWHLGHTLPHLPTNHGFDTYVGIPYHMSGGSIDEHICTYDDDDEQNNYDDNDTKPKQWLPLFKNTTIVQQPVNVHTLAETYVKEATNFMQQQIQTDTPYFLYMAFSHVHQLCASYTQIEQTTCQWSGHHANTTTGYTGSRKSSSSHPTFTDAIQEMDWMVGQILDTIRHDPIQLNNTIIVFTSDNGPWLAEQSCSGLRGPYHAQWYVCMYDDVYFVFIVLYAWIYVFLKNSRSGAHFHVYNKGYGITYQ